MPHSSLTLFLWLFLVVPGNSVFAQSIPEIPLTEALEKLENTFGVRFSFVKDELEGVRVSYENLETLEAELAGFERETIFRFNRISDRYYSVVRNDSGFRCAQLIAADTGSPLSGATVLSAASSFTAITNENGYFHLPETVADGELEIRYLGYETMQLSAEELSEECSPILMQTILSNLNTVFVTRYLVPGLDRNTDGSISIDTRSFGLLPGQVENDVLQIAQTIPGVQSVNESISNINIRSGTNDENLILWNDIKMYQNGHFFGLITAFNPDITTEVKVYKNGSPARYGDGVSGTIAMNSINSAVQDLSVKAGINLLNANAYVMMPIGKSASVELAGRRSINDLWETNAYRSYANKAFQDTEVTSTTASGGVEIDTREDFSFYDFSARFLWDITPKDKVRINFLTLSNQIDLTENIIETGTLDNNNLDQKSQAYGISWERNWSEKLRTKFTGYATIYELNALNRDIQSSQEVIQENEVLETSALFSASYRANPNWSLNGGYQFTETGITNTQDVNLPRFRDFEKDVIRSHSTFAAISFNSTDDRTRFSAAARANYFDKLEQFRFEPRLTAIQSLLKGLSVELLAEMKSQVTAQRIDFNSDFLGLENRRWILADGRDVPVKESGQVSLGLVYDLDNWLLSGTVFLKEVTGVTASNQGFQNQFQFQQASGSYTASGSELVLNRRTGNYSFWLSYAYLDSQYDFPDLNPQRFAHNLEISHSVNLAGTYYSGPLKLAAGLNWRTGKPYTIPVEDDELIVNGAERTVNFDQPNEQQLENYLRLDASIEYKASLSDNIRMSINLSVLNILDQEIVLNRRFTPSTTVGQEDLVNQIDSFSLGITPNLAVRVYF